MMGRGRVSDADASSQQNGHLQTAAAHVLHLCDLIDDFTERIVDEVDEHEVDDRPGSGHGSAATQADEPALCNRRVAESLRAILREQTGCRGEVSTSLVRSPPRKQRCGGRRSSRCRAPRAWRRRRRVRGRSAGLARVRAAWPARHRREWQQYSHRATEHSRQRRSHAPLHRGSRRRSRSSSASVAWPESIRTPRKRWMGQRSRHSATSSRVRYV